uniref:B30.2/SPRY domain-containing protein n=1 Tax=Oryzias latipes TaxID=8090 RepID=A0A3P9LGB7_ORYLA
MQDSWFQSAEQEQDCWEGEVADTCTVKVPPHNDRLQAVRDGDRGGPGRSRPGGNGPEAGSVRSMKAPLDRNPPKENRKVTVMEKSQIYSDHPDRFTDCFQVLSRESLTGRCYWEVERRGKYVYIAVTYKNISRSGDESLFGFNDKSWALDCSPDRFSFYHNGIKTSISAPASSRVGVYLDHRAGVLSFYSVSESMTLLHRVQTTFRRSMLNLVSSNVLVLHLKIRTWGSEKPAETIRKLSLENCPRNFPEVFIKKNSLHRCSLD